MQERRAVEERRAVQEWRAGEEQRVAEQAAAHAHKQQLAVLPGSEARVER